MPLIYVTAIASPKPGKEARVNEILDKIVETMKTTEPEAQSYIVTKAFDSTDIVIREVYASMSAFEFHKEQKYFKDFIAAVQGEDLLTKPPVIIASEQVGGFVSK